MTGAPRIAIDSLSLPLPSGEAAARAAQAMGEEIQRLYRADLASGLSWRGSAEAMTLDAPEEGDPVTLGRALAQALRRRLLTEPRR